MKELNEYRQEIFRRSAEKKRQIKKRRRIALGVGIPLCLCCVLTVTLLPGGLSKGVLVPSMDMAVNESADCEDSAIGLQSFYVTDSQKVSDILAVLEGNYTQQESASDENNGVADQMTPGSYRFTLELSDGSVLSYYIMGNDAYCETDGQSQTLSPAQAQALYELLTDS